MIPKLLPGFTELFARKVSQGPLAVGIGYHSVFRGESTSRGLASHQVIFEYFTCQQLRECGFDCAVALGNAKMSFSIAGFPSRVIFFSQIMSRALLFVLFALWMQRFITSVFRGQADQRNAFAPKAYEHILLFRKRSTARSLSLKISVLLTDS